MTPNGKMKVLATTAQVCDLVANVGGEHVDAITLITGEMDPHSYELVKGDDEKLSYARLLFYNGLGLEHGASLKHRLQTHPGGVSIGDSILARQRARILSVDQQLDPHIWMDISLWMEGIDAVVQALSQADPEHAAYFAENGSALRVRMTAAHQRIVEAMECVPAHKRYLVTSHDAFNYFTRAYLAEPEERDSGKWEERFEAPEGLAPDGQLSAADIQRLIDYLCAHQIGVVFPESNVSRDSLRKIVSACLSKGLVVTLSSDPLYGDAMGPPGSGADAYLGMMQHNAAVILAGWGGCP
jgi:manganese/zinc/iron transport system substrate-binding protein